MKSSRRAALTFDRSGLGRRARPFGAGRPMMIMPVALPAPPAAWADQAATLQVA